MGLDVAEIGMGADLSLDLRHFASKAVRQARDAPASSELDAFIRQLEEEQCKIVAFRSELPLCVRIVAYAIGAMKEEKRKSDGEEEEEDGAAADKSKWMSTAQLWTGGSDRESEKQADKLQGRNALRSKSCGGGGAFVPFKAVGSGAPAFGPPLYTRKDDSKQPPPADAAVPDLSLLTPPAIQSGVADESRRHVVGFAQAAARAAAMAPAAAPALSLQPQQPQPQAAQQQQQQPRKSRRCWSTELHRQFVAALNQLGGPHAATPKQIRELMKVDGLTNDEVKSHLQKYRLHNRRTPGSAVVNHQPIMVVGGLWIPHHQQEPSSSSHQSGSPHGPLHLSTASGIVAASSSAATGSGEEEDGSCRSADSYGWI